MCVCACQSGHWVTTVYHVGLVRGPVAGFRTPQTQYFGMNIHWPSSITSPLALPPMIRFSCRSSLQPGLHTQRRPLSLCFSPPVTLLSTPPLYLSLEHPTLVDNLRHISYCCCSSFSHPSLSLSLFHSSACIYIYHSLFHLSIHLFSWFLSL